MSNIASYKRGNSPINHDMKMKRILITLAVVLSFSCSWAQCGMDDIWKAMPDSMVRYLNATKRAEMVDFYHMGVKAETFNLLSTSTVMDSLTNNYADVRLSESSRMQLSLLPLEDGDTLLCVVTTFLGEAPESVVRFYDLSWHSLDHHQYIDDVSPVSLMSRPDTMSVEEYDRRVLLIDPVMIGAEMSADGQSLELSLSTPLLSRQEREEASAILVQRKLKWNGKKFN